MLEPNSDRGPQSLKATWPLAIIPSVLTTRPWPIRQKWTGTSRMVPHTRHNNKPTLSRNHSPLGCLHLALAYWYYFCMEDTLDHVSVHWQQGNYQLWANCYKCRNPVAIVGFRFSRQLRHLLLCRVLTIRPWPVHQKRNGPSWMVSHNQHNNESTLSRRNSPLGCLHLALAYRYYFYGGNMR